MVYLHTGRAPDVRARHDTCLGWPEWKIQNRSKSFKLNFRSTHDAMFFGGFRTNPCFCGVKFRQHSQIYIYLLVDPVKPTVWYERRQRLVLLAAARYILQ
jgi:hypothetical protein